MVSRLKDHGERGFVIKTNCEWMSPECGVTNNEESMHGDETTCQTKQTKKYLP